MISLHFLFLFVSVYTEYYSFLILQLEVQLLLVFIFSHYNTTLGEKTMFIYQMSMLLI